MVTSSAHISSGWSGMAEDEARTELEHEFLDNAKSFNWATVKTMLERTPDLINVQPAGRWSALHQAAYEGNGEMAQFLLSKGADNQSLTRNQKTPLNVAKGSAVEALKVETGEAAKEDGADTTTEPPKKKARAKSTPDYLLNINLAVDKEFEGSSFAEIALAPTSALQGIGDKSREVLRQFGIKTVKDLGTWKFYRMSKALAGLAPLEQPDRRQEGASMNANKALDKKHEKKPLQDISVLPPSALQGLAGWADDELAKLHIKTIAQLGDWKYAKWAEWIVVLSEFETADFSS